jgi:hypothetical protein
VVCAAPFRRSVPAYFFFAAARASAMA